MQDFLHERRLALGVGLAVLAVADGQVVLERAEAGQGIGMFTQVVPEQQLITVAGATDGTRCRWWVRRAGCGLQNQSISPAR